MFSEQESTVVTVSTCVMCCIFVLPGLDRLVPHGANPLDPHWLELQRRYGYPPGAPLVPAHTGSSSSSTPHIPGVYPPASLASDLMAREREKLDRLGEWQRPLRSQVPPNYQKTMLIFDQGCTVRYTFTNLSGSEIVGLLKWWSMQVMITLAIWLLCWTELCSTKSYKNNVYWVGVMTIVTLCHC